MFALSKKELKLIKEMESKGYEIYDRGIKVSADNNVVNYIEFSSKENPYEISFVYDSIIGLKEIK